MGSHKPDTLGCNGRRNIGTVRSKRTNYGDILDDTFGEKTKEIDTWISFCFNLS
jgi:hypothetical protein